MSDTKVGRLDAVLLVNYLQSDDAEWRVRLVEDASAQDGDASSLSGADVATYRPGFEQRAILDRVLSQAASLPQRRADLDVVAQQSVEELAATLSVSSFGLMSAAQRQTVMEKVRTADVTKQERFAARVLIPSLNLMARPQCTQEMARRGQEVVGALLGLDAGVVAHVLPQLSPNVVGAFRSNLIDRAIWASPRDVAELARTNTATSGRDRAVLLGPLLKAGSVDAAYRLLQIRGVTLQTKDPTATETQALAEVLAVASPDALARLRERYNDQVTLPLHVGFVGGLVGPDGISLLQTETTFWVSQLVELAIEQHPKLFSPERLEQLRHSLHPGRAKSAPERAPTAGKGERPA